MTVNHDVVSSSLTGAANKNTTQQGGVFCWLFLFCSCRHQINSHLRVYAEVKGLCNVFRFRLWRNGGCLNRQGKLADFGTAEVEASVRAGWTCIRLACARTLPPPSPTSAAPNVDSATSFYTREVNSLRLFACGKNPPPSEREAPPYSCFFSPTMLYSP